MDKEAIDNIYKHFRYRFLKLNIFPAFLGLLLICTPTLLNYTQRDLIVSDSVCGVVLILLSLVFLKRRDFLWLGAFIGLWVILFACIQGRPSVAFAHDTLVGFAILAVVCISPTRPEALEVGPTLPEGSSYNPSAGGRRAAVLVICSLAWLHTRYLTAASLGISEITLSKFSMIYPMLMTAYTLLVVLSLAGSERRWHTRPKIVIATALTLGSSIVLTLVPIVLYLQRFDCWLCFCLTLEPALAMAFAYDEVLATVKYLLQFWEDKKTLLQTAFLGSEYYKHTLLWEERTVLPLQRACKQAFLGISFPLNQVVQVVVVAIFIKIIGTMQPSPILKSFLNICCWAILVFSTLAFSKSLRQIRWINLLFSAAILLSPVFFHIHIHAPLFLPILITGILSFILTVVGKGTLRA